MSQRIRFHRKSRNGCQNCKSRHVKCDESRPRCKDCTRREEVCSFERPAIRSTSPLSDSQAIERLTPPSHALHPVQDVPEEPRYSPKCLLDLRLMHHYSIFAAQALANTLDENVVNALKVQIPQLALEHEFLMDAVLLVAMVHFCCVDNSAEHFPLFIYRDQALRGLRQAVANLSNDNIHALRGASVLLAAVSFPADRWTNQSGLWVTNWMALALGQRNFRGVRDLSRPSHDDEKIPQFGGLYGCFADRLAPAVVPHTIQRALEINERGNDVQYELTLRTVAAELGRLVSILKTPYETQFLEKKIKGWAFDVISPDFFTFVQQNRSEALVILAYYLALFKFLPDSWIYHGLPQHDIGVMVDVIDAKWKEHLSLPATIIEMANKEDAEALLMTCL